MRVVGSLAASTGGPPPRLDAGSGADAEAGFGHRRKVNRGSSIRLAAGRPDVRTL
jgi:hypothetical protein